MTDLDEHAMAKLAREMVMCIRNYKTIFADFGINEEDYYEICKNNYYKRIKEHFTIEWNSTVSTADRVKLQGQAGTEVLLPEVIRRALRQEESLTSLIESAKFVAKVGGIGGENKSEPKSSEKFTITINIGNNSKTYEKSIEPETLDLIPAK